MQANDFFLGLKNKYSDEETQVLINSVRQDPLVWDYIMDNSFGQDVFNATGSALADWSPAALAVQSLHLPQSVEAFHADPNLSLDPDIRQSAIRIYENAINNAQTPENLGQAGLLALALREKLRVKHSWYGLDADLAIHQPYGTDALFPVWRSALAVLFGFAPDPLELLKALLPLTEIDPNDTAKGLLLHAIFANPLPSNQQPNLLFAILSMCSPAVQLSWLTQIELSGRANILASLSANLLETPRNKTCFTQANNILKPENHKTYQSDPLEIIPDLSAIESCRHQSELNRLAGNTKESIILSEQVQGYLHRIQASEASKIAALSQSFSSPTQSIPMWEKVVELAPGSELALAGLAEALVSENRLEDASSLLNFDCTHPSALLVKTQIAHIKGDNESVKKYLLSAFEAINKRLTDAGQSKNGIDIYALKLVNQLLEHGLSSQALQITQNLLKYRPYDPDLLTLHSKASLVGGYYDESIQTLQVSTLMEPGNIQRHRLLADILEKAQRLGAAYEERDRVFRLATPPDLSDLYALASIAIKVGRLEVTQKICKLILDRDAEDGKAFTYLGQADLLSNKIESAIENFNQAIQFTPNDSQPWLALTQTYTTSGDHFKALETLRTAVQANPDSIEILLALGEMYLFLGSPSEALPYLRTAHQYWPDNPSTCLALGKGYYRLHLLDEGRRVLAPTREMWKDNPEIAFIFGKIMLGLNEEELALPGLIAGTKDQTEAEPYLLLAKTILSLHSKKSKTQIYLNEKSGWVEKEPELILALDAIQKAVTFDPDQTELKVLHAEILLLNKEYQAALDEFISIQPEINLEPEYIWRIKLGSGCSALLLDRVELALTALQEADRLKPNSIPIQRSLAEAYLAANFQDEAYQTALASYQLGPNELDNQVWFVRFTYKQGKYSESINTLEKAIHCWPDQGDLIFWLARIHFQTGDQNNSFNACLRLLKFPYIFPQYLKQAAGFLIKMGYFAEAVTCLEKAATEEANPKSDITVALAWAYRLNGQHEKALDTLEGALRNDLENMPLIILQADFLVQLGRKQEAELCLEQLLQVFKRIQAKGLTSPGTESAIESEDFPTIGCELNISGIHHRLVWLKRETNNLPNALYHAEESLRLAPGNLSIRYLAVELAFSLMESDRARMLSGWPTVFDNSSLPVTDDPADRFYLSGIANFLVELALDRQDIEAANQIINRVSDLNLSDRRTSTSKIRIKLLQEEEVSVAQLMNQFSGDETPNTLKNEFGWPCIDHSLVWYMLNLAETALAMKSWSTALEWFAQVSHSVPFEPRPHLRFARALVLAAETQYTFQALRACGHAPGEDKQSLKNAESFEAEIKQSAYAVNASEVLKWQARGQAIFHPDQPASLNLRHQSTTEEDIAALVMCLCRSDNLDEARNIINQHPDNILAMLQLGISFMLIQPDFSLSLVQTIIEKEPANPLHQALFAFLTQHETATSLQAIENALVFWPDEIEWHRFAAEMAVLTSNLTGAITHWREVIRLMPGNPWYLQALGQALFENEQYNDAINTLEEVTGLSPDQYEAWVTLSKAYYQIGSSSKALDCASKACSLQPRLVEPHILIGKAALDQVQPEVASSEAQLALEIDPLNTEAILILARAQTQMGHPEGALDLLNRFNRNSEVPFEVLLEKARLQKHVHGSQAALPLLQQLNSEHPGDINVLVPLAEVLVEVGQVKQGEQIAQAALQIDPDQTSLHFIMGRLLRLQGQLDQAVYHLSEAIRQCPDLLDAYIELGRVYQDRREFSQALDVYRRAITVSPNDYSSYYQAGLIFRNNKDYRNAETMLRHASRLAPDDVTIHRQLGAIMTLNLVHNPQELPVKL